MLLIYLHVNQTRAIGVQSNNLQQSGLNHVSYAATCKIYHVTPDRQCTNAPTHEILIGWQVIIAAAKKIGVEL